MNRSFHAFAVLLVSLAGGMIAATWTSSLSSSRDVRHANVSSKVTPGSLHCSCNPDSLMRLEEGCARDKTTGEVYGCEIGRGVFGTDQKSVLSQGANYGANSLVRLTVAMRHGISRMPWPEFAAQTQGLKYQLAKIQAQFPRLETKPQHELDYAAAESAAAGLGQATPEASWLKVNERVAPLYQAISAGEMHNLSKSTAAFLGSVSRKCDRQTRLWLVESGFHQQWDAAEQVVVQEQLLAGARLKIDDESIDRWFENFPPPVTVPNRLINPLEPTPDDEESRRIILATAKVLETLSDLFHQTAENLARHAEQDVAKLHKLKSGIEERR
jgi:hypothetical protein